MNKYHKRFWRSLKYKLSHGAYVIIFVVLHVSSCNSSLNVEVKSGAELTKSSVQLGTNTLANSETAKTPVVTSAAIPSPAETSVVIPPVTTKALKMESAAPSPAVAFNPSFTIKPGPALMVTLEFLAEGASAMYVTNTAGCGAKGEWEPFAPSKQWDLFQSEGEAFVYVKFKNQAGQESDCLSRSIVIQRNKPNARLFAIQGGAPAVATSQVTLTLEAAEAPGLHMYITNTPNCVSEGIWESFSTTKSWTLAQRNSLAAVYAKFKNPVGTETSCQSLSIMHDDALPPAPIGVSLGTVPPGFTSSPPLTWSEATSGPSGIGGYEARVLKSSDQSVVKSWTKLVSGESLSSLNLDRFTSYQMEVRALSGAGLSGPSVLSSSWLPDSDNCSGARLTSTPFAAGSGTQGDPYVICTRSHLEQLNTMIGRSNFAKFFALGAHLDLSSQPWTPVGTQAVPFMGRFLGQNRTLKGLNIVGNTDDVGFFGYLRVAYVSSIQFEAPMIDASSRNRVGILTGYIYVSTIENIRVNAALVKANSQVGLIAGSCDMSTIQNSTIKGTIQATGYSIGGILGLVNYACTIYEGSVDVVLTGGSKVGSIIGNSDWISEIQGITAKGQLVGGDQIGGFVGYSGNTYLTRSRFEGTLQGTYAVGGIMGYSSYNTAFVEVESKFTITGENQLGGVLGYDGYKNRSKDLLVSGTINGTGAVAGASAGGYCGYADEAGSVDRSIFNVDIISNFPRVGGVVGYKPWYPIGLTDIITTGSISGHSATNTVSPFIGEAAGSTTVVNGFYWTGASCTNAVGSCNTNFGSGFASLLSMYNKTTFPLSGWDFTNISQEQNNGFPKLRMLRQATPEITSHTCPVSMTAGGTASCFIFMNDTDLRKLRAVKVLPESSCAFIQVERSHNYLPDSNSYRGVFMDPTAADIGTCNFVFAVTDGLNTSAPYTLTITVN